MDVSPVSMSAPTSNLKVSVLTTKSIEDHAVRQIHEQCLKLDAMRKC